MNEIAQFIKQSKFSKSVLTVPLALRRRYLRRKMAAKFEVTRALAKYVRGDVLIEVPEFDGVFAMSPCSSILHTLLIYSQYEPLVSKLFLKHVIDEGDVVDIGANIGLYTIGAAKQLTTGRVLAVEPTSGAFARLVQNISANGMTERAIAERAIVTHQDSTETSINIIPGSEEYSSLGILRHESAANKEYVCERVRSVTLDSLVNKHELKPTMIKIDVEGAEYKVLKGGLNTIRKYKPIILSELSGSLLREQESTPKQFLDELALLGYDIVNPEAPLIPINDDYEGSIFCIPSK